jgi:hypothetical protein
LGTSFKEDAMIYDMLVEDKWLDKDNEEQSALRKVGTAFDLKGGGRRNIPFTGVAITGPFLTLPRKKKPADVPEAEDSGEDFLG